MVQLQALLPQLKEAGIGLLAIAPDAPEDLHKTARRHDLSFPLLSDGDLAAARSFGIAFASGKTGLPVPAVFVVGMDGQIRFQHVDPNYRVRLDDAVLLAAARLGLDRP